MPLGTCCVQAFLFSVFKPSAMPTTPSLALHVAEVSSADAIADALEKHKQVAEEIKEVAEELGVVHAVLDTQIPGDAHHADVDEAVARTDALEKRLNESVKVLEDATEALEQEVKALQAGQES
jgi:ABC-type Fe3+-citrate transport system substrate-binding protein